MKDLSSNINQEFEDRFKSKPILVQSPGRVNLIGEHTDYNDGFVLPAAIQKVIMLGLAPNGLDSVRAYSVDMDEEVTLDLTHLESSDKHWANYIKGVIAELREQGYESKGFDLVFGGNIPIGAGLSSSAALEGGLLVGLSELFDFDVDRKTMARIGQLTEHNHVGVRCGIMDQFINLHGEEHKVLQLDCRSLEYELFPFERDDIIIVLCNSKVSHNLASSEYNVRREQCEAGVEVLRTFDSDIINLRDVSIEFLEAHEADMDPLVYKRCKYVVEENNRVVAACRDLEKGDFEAFGQRMFQSHNGLSNDYEVSCEELDVLVDVAKEQPGLLGSRMMGGGFGGCTINLVEEAKVEEFVAAVSAEYTQRTGKETEIYITSINAGAKIV